MNSYQAGKVVGRILGTAVALTLTLAYRSFMGFTSLAAKGTATLVPEASSTGEVVGRATLAGGIWVVVFGLIAAAISRDGTITLVGMGLGLAVGLLVAFALIERGKAEVKAAEGAVQFGERTGAMGVVRPHVVERATRVRHVAVFGATGSGKSTVIKNLLRQDAAAPGQPGILCIDVKDDLVLDVAAHLPPERADDVLLFDPADVAFPPAFNPFAGVPQEARTLATAEMLSAIKRLFAESWGPRLEHVLRHVLLTLLETPNATFLDIARILTDQEYRSWAVGHVTNFSVSEFWEREFPSITGKNGSIANVESLLNKLGVLAYPEVRNVLGQSRRGLDLREAMDGGKIVLAHLPQGVLGEDASHFLGALLVGKVQLAAQSRVNLPHEQRRPFYVFADEFQNYETSAFDKLITEGRSMGVGLVAACQFREQLVPHLRLALERNCAYALNCRLVDNGHTVNVVKLQEPEAPDASMLLRPLPPPSESVAGQLARIRNHSRQLLAEPRTTVEADLGLRRHFSKQPAATATAEPPKPPPEQPARQRRPRIVPDKE